MDLLAMVRVMDARVDDWNKKICDELIRRRNFAVILKDSSAVQQLSDLLQCAEPPQRLDRFGIYALADVLTMNDYVLLLELYTRYDIRFVEQLNMAANKPPEVKPFILYCELRGIISDHDSLPEAEGTLQSYIHKFERVKLFPLAGIYQFRDQKWERIRQLL